MALQKLRGQQHLLQRLFAEDLKLAADPLDVELAMDDRRLMLFEWAKYGALSDLLRRHGDESRSADDQLALPNRALVQIFHCCEFFRCCLLVKSWRAVCEY